MFLQGIFLGFSIAAPVGPIGVLCIRRTLADGRLAGFLSGLGAASADMLYGAIAAFGLTAVMDLLVGAQFWLRAVGGLFLLYLGIRTFFAKPASESASARGGTGLLAAYASTFLFLLTVTNPMTILAFLPADATMNAASSTSIVLGVFLGSAAWWLALSGLVSLVREKFTPAWMQWVNRASGAIITGFAIYILAGIK